MIEIRGARIFTDEVGSGPVALVLHGGLGLDQTMYRSLDPLASALRMVYMDVRGNGRSIADVSAVTMRQWADDAAAVARSIAGDEPVIVIGHSYGGFIAQETAIAHGRSVRALILLNTTPGQLGVAEEPAPEGPPVPADFIEMLSSMPQLDDELESFMDRLAPAYMHRESPDVLRDLMKETTFRAAAMRRGFEVLAQWSSVDRLAMVTAPTLIVAGRHDAFTAWPQAERMATKLADADVVVFEESGHFPWIDEPDAFFPVIVDWLRRRDLTDG